LVLDAELDAQGQFDGEVYLDLIDLETDEYVDWYQSSVQNIPYDKTTVHYSTYNAAIDAGWSVNTY